MLNSFHKFLIIFFILILPITLFSQDTGFRKGRTYFEYKYGFTYFHNGSLVENVHDKNKLIVPAIVGADDAFLYGFSRSDSNKPHLFSNSNNFLFEYGLSDKWGIGFTFHRETYNANNLSTSNFAQNLLFTSLLYGQTINTQALADLNKRYVGLKENTKVMDVVSLDFNLAYHFSPNQKWDPYVRFGLGKGFDTFSPSTHITRLSGYLGTRYFITENFYLVGELGLAHHEVYRVSKQSPIARFAPNGVLNEAYVQVGAGVSLGEFWKRNPKSKEEHKEEVVTKEEVKPEPVKPPEENEIKKIAREYDIGLSKRDNKLALTLPNEGSFDSGSDKLSKKGENAVKGLALIMQKMKGVNYTIEGHTDNVPTTTLKFKSNQELSLARAVNVKNLLIQESIEESRLSTLGQGDTKPVQSNATPEGRKANRRIEVITDKDISEIPELNGAL
ncbi:MAG: OmpA family protein [Leptospiraceae bacterium]|nr:OmpA family protein [Leptospiraceae bacterium]